MIFSPLLYTFPHTLHKTLSTSSYFLSVKPNKAPSMTAKVPNKPQNLENSAKTTPSKNAIIPITIPPLL